MSILGSKHVKANRVIVLIGFITGFCLMDFGQLVVGRAEQIRGELTASLDRTGVQVGDVVSLTLHYRLPEGGMLPESPTIGGIEGITRLDQVVEPGRIRIKLFVDRLELWQSDALTLSFIDRERKVQMLKTDPVSLTVNSVLGEKPMDAVLRPIRDIILTKNWWQSYWMWIIGPAGLLLILSCAYFWYRKTQLRTVSENMIEPPHISARKALEELDKSGVFEKGKAKAFYFMFSEIMRQYLESIRHFPAAEYTTEEISQQIRLEVDRKLLTLLHQADLVKFADTIPTPDRKEEDVRSALSYIEETEPTPIETANVESSSRTAGGNA